MADQSARVQWDIVVTGEDRLDAAAKKEAALQQAAESGSQALAKQSEAMEQTAVSAAGLTGNLQKLYTEGLTLKEALGRLEAANAQVAGSQRQAASAVQQTIEARAKEGQSAEQTGRRVSAAVQALSRDEQQRTRVAQQEADKRIEGARREAESLSKLAEQTRARLRASPSAGGGGGNGLATLSTIESGLANPLGAVGTAAKEALASIGPLGIGIAATGVAAVLTGRQLFSLAEASGQLAEQQANTAERTGLTIREVGLFSAAAENAGVNANAFTTAMRTLSQALSEDTEEGKRAKKTLADLGVEATNQFGTVKPIGQLYLEIADALSKIEEPGKRADAVQRLFGRGGLELLPLLRGEFRETIAEVEKLGVAFSEEGAAKAQEFDNALDRLSTRMKALAREAGITGAEIIKALFPSLFDRPGKSGETAAGQQDAIEARTEEIRRQLRERNQDLATLRSGRDLTLNAPGILAGILEPVGPGSVSAADLEAQQRAARQREIQSILRTSGNARQNLQAELTGARGDLAAAVKANDPEAVRAASDRVRELEQQIGALKTSTQAERKYAAVLESLTQQRARSAERLFADEGDPAQKIEAEFQDRVRKVNSTPGLSKSERGKLTQIAADIYYQDAQKILNDQLTAIEKGDAELAKLFADAKKRIDQENQKNIDGGLAQSDVIRDRILRTQQDRVANQASTELRTQAIQTRVAVASVDPRDQVAAINTEAARRKEAADYALAKAKEVAALELDIVRRNELLYRADRDYRVETEEILADKRLNLLAIERRHQEESRGIAASFYDSLFGGRKGIADFFTQELKNAGRTIFANVFQQPVENQLKQLGSIIPGQRDTRTGEPTGIGKALQGSIFGERIETVTSANTTATIANTAAIAQMSATLSGTGSTASGSAASGLGALGKIFGGSTKNPFIFNAVGGTEEDPLSGGFSSGKNGDFGGETSSPASPGGSSFGKYLGYAGAAGGAFGIYSGIKQGGAQGALTASASALGVAAAFDPEPISKAALTIAAMATGFVKGLLPDPKKARDEAINNYLNEAKYSAPSSISLEEASDGRAVSRDFRGGLRTLNESAEIERYQRLTGFDATRDNRPEYAEDRRVTETRIQAPASAPVYNINLAVNAIDSRGFCDYVPEIGDALKSAIQAGHPVGREIASLPRGF